MSEAGQGSGESQARRSRAQEVGHLIGLVARTRWGRYLLLAPTALSLIANLSGIGEVASFLVRQWDKIIEVVGKPIRELLNYDLLRDAGGVVFFLPFVVVGLIALVRGKQERVSVFSAFLAYFVFLAFLIAVQHQSPWYDIHITLAGAFGLAIVMMAVRWVVIRLGGGARAQFLCLHFVCAFAATGYMLYRDFILYSFGEYPYLYPFLGAVMALPLMAPHRLIQVGILVGGIISISLINDWARSLL